jgi:hypothetical protein
MNTYEIRYDEYIGFNYENDSPEKAELYQARTATQALRSFYAARPLYAINSIKRVTVGEKKNREE